MRDRSSGPADTGSFTPGKNGTVVVNVPLSVVGNPKLGAVLTAPNGQTKVLVGAIKPHECKVFGTACTPERPLGTCMVSAEGACAAYYAYGRHAA